MDSELYDPHNITWFRAIADFRDYSRDFAISHVVTQFKFVGFYVQ